MKRKKRKRNHREAYVRERERRERSGWHGGGYQVEEIAERVRVEEYCFRQIGALAGVDRTEAMNIFRANRCDPALALEAAVELHRVAV
jgi:hypothetical protein